MGGKNFCNLLLAIFCLLSAAQTWALEEGKIFASHQQCSTTNADVPLNLINLYLPLSAKLRSSFKTPNLSLYALDPYTKAQPKIVDKLSDTTQYSTYNWRQNMENYSFKDYHSSLNDQVRHTKQQKVESAQQ